MGLFKDDRNFIQKWRDNRKSKLNISLSEKARYGIAGLAKLDINRAIGGELLHRIPNPTAGIKTASNQLKKIFVKGYNKKDGNRVKDFFRTIVSAPIKALTESDLKSFKISGNTKIASANKTFVVTSGGSKYIYKESPYNFALDFFKNPLGFRYSRKVGHPVSEAFYSDLAKRAGVNSQETLLVAANTKRGFGSKNPATLHKFVAGIEAREAAIKGYIKTIGKTNDAGFSLKPTVDSRNETKHDFTRKIRQAMLHKDTSKILALDIFTSNMDRHGNNLFYDKLTNRFTGIDHGESLAIRPDFFGIKSGIVNGYDKMSATEKQNLKVFKKTLSNIVKDNPPESSKAKLDKYYQKVEPGLNKYDRYVAKQAIERKKEIAEKNYNDSQEFITWMDDKGI